MSEKIKLKGQLKLPVVGKNPTFAQMKFVKVALSEPDILPDSGSIFTCDEQGNYDFEIYTGKHLLSYNVGNAWSKPIEIIAEPLAEGLESIEISDLIGFQEIPELDATIAALNQQKQELLAIQQDVVLKQEDAAASAAAAAEDAAKLADITPEDIGAANNYGVCYLKPLGGTVYLGGLTFYNNVKIDFPFEPYMLSMQVSMMNNTNTITSELFLSCTYAASSKTWTDPRSVQVGGSIPINAKLCFDVEKNKPYIVIDGFNLTGISFCITKVVSKQTTEDPVSGLEWTLTPNFAIKESEILQEISPTHYASDASGARVRSMQHNNVNYQFVDLDEALSIGILQSDFDAALGKQQAQDFFESEKAKAILIMNDHMLGTGQEEITDLQVMDVKAYIQSIDPSKGFKVGIVRAKVPRPSIFSRYD